MMLRKDIDLLEKQIAERDAQLARREAQLAECDAQLVEIYSSRAWRFMLFLRKVRTLLAPPASQRERILVLTWKALRILRLEGFGALLKRSGEWFKHTCIAPVNRFMPSKIRHQGTYRSIKGLPTRLFEKARELELSGKFDCAWYFSTNPDVERKGVNPIEHYLLHGIHDEKNPTALFNTTIYVRSLGEAINKEDAFIHFIKSGRLFAPGAYKNAEILITAQKKYFQEVDMECMKNTREQERKFAVYFQCGAGSIHNQWLSGEPRKWDLLVNHYDQTYFGKIDCEVEFKQTGKHPGTKFTSFNFLLQNFTDLINKYDYVLLLDDDILIKQQDIDLLFSITAENNLDMAQASLTFDSFCAHPVFKTMAKNGIRYVNAVEIMMPVLSQRVIQIGTHLFGETVSGWGLDLALSKVAGPNRKIAVIDTVIAKHSKPINVEGGAFYKMLHRAFIYPEIELTHLQRVYKLGRVFYTTNSK